MAFVDTSGTECKDIFPLKSCNRMIWGCFHKQTEFLCAKTCALHKLKVEGIDTKCEDPNTNKECKNIPPGKIL